MTTENLKVGDEVAIRKLWSTGRETYRIGTISKLTKAGSADVKSGQQTYRFDRFGREKIVRGTYLAMLTEEVRSLVMQAQCD